MSFAPTTKNTYRYDKEDVWQFGSLLYHTLCSQNYINDDLYSKDDFKDNWNESEIYEKINDKINQLIETNSRNISKKSKILIKRCLEIDEDKRISINDIFKLRPFIHFENGNQDYDHEYEECSQYLKSVLEIPNNKIIKYFNTSQKTLTITSLRNLKPDDKKIQSAKESNVSNVSS